jgi:hypothetical protein
MSSDGKGIIPLLCLSVLGRAVGASWFHFLAKLCKRHINKGMRSGKFPILVAPYEIANIPVTAECLKEKAHHVQRGGFTPGDEYLHHGQFVIHNEEIGAVSITRVDDAVVVDIWA